MNTISPWVAAGAGACLLMACGGGGGNGDGQLKLSVADAPVDGVDAVVVEFTGIEIKPAQGAAISLDLAAPRQIDLLDTVNGNAIVLIDPAGVPAGDYEWLRLKVVTDRDSAEHSYVQTGSQRQPLFVPSGSESGLKLINGFTVPDGGLQALTVDFDLRRSVIKPNGQSGYFLKPVLRLVDDDEVGRIAGTIPAELLGLAGCPAEDLAAGAAVYVYAGADQLPDDMAGANANLVISTGISAGATADAAYTFNVAWLPPGDYTLALSCQGLLDDPEADDAILFTEPVNLSISAGQTTAISL